MRQLAADRAVLADAADNAAQWIGGPAAGGLQACACEMNRFYTVFERILERICESFENHLDKSGNYHERLVHRLALDLPGLRPAFLPAEVVPQITELRRFRHLVRHAYDLTLRADRLRELIEAARRMNTALPAWSERFAAEVRREQGWREG
jgi:HepT-like protein